jgi:hypothetical protein
VGMGGGGGGGVGPPPPPPVVTEELAHAQPGHDEAERPPAALISWARRTTTTTPRRCYRGPLCSLRPGQPVGSLLVSSGRTPPRPRRLRRHRPGRRRGPGPRRGRRGCLGCGVPPRHRDGSTPPARVSRDRFARPAAALDTPSVGALRQACRGGRGMGGEGPGRVVAPRCRPAVVRCLSSRHDAPDKRSCGPGPSLATAAALVLSQPS